MSALVLLYHSVSENPLPGLGPWTVTPALMEEHARVIASCGRPVVTFSQLITARHSGTVEPDTVVITFDDGYQDNLLAAEILARQRLPATIYVTTDAIGRTRMLNPADLPELIRKGWEIGSHGVTHRRLDELEIDQARHELVSSRLTLQEISGGRVDSYAYPHGSYTKALAVEAAIAGYSSAAAVRDSLSADDDDPYAVARMTVPAGLTADALVGWLDNGGLPTSTPTSPVLTEAYRVFRRTRTALRGEPADELARRLQAVENEGQGEN
jgi:peptidoglycan/xylan/chitin deacetylase (PgdA/CDA1 family)